MSQDIVRSIKRRNRRFAALITICSIVILSAAVLIMFLIPSIHEVVKENYIYIAAVFAIAVISLAIASYRTASL